MLNNQTGKHRKLSAVKKPQKAEGLVLNVGVGGGPSPFINYLEDFVQHHKKSEDDKVDEAEQLEDKKVVEPLI